MSKSLKGQGGKLGKARRRAVASSASGLRCGRSKGAGTARGTVRARRGAGLGRGESPGAAQAGGAGRGVQALGAQWRRHKLRSASGLRRLQRHGGRGTSAFCRRLTDQRARRKAAPAKSRHGGIKIPRERGMAVLMCRKGEHWLKSQPRFFSLHCSVKSNKNMPDSSMRHE